MNAGIIEIASEPKKRADPRTSSMDDAESLTGISHQQVSRWAKRLANGEFVRWWTEAVRPDGRPSKTVAGRGQLSADDAESLTGVTKQQVSRWAIRAAADEVRRAERRCLALEREAGR